MTNLCVNVLLSYRKYCATVSSSGQLILPEALKLLPLYTIGVYFIHSEICLIDPRLSYPCVRNFLYFDIQFLPVRFLGAIIFCTWILNFVMLINNYLENAKKHLYENLVVYDLWITYGIWKIWDLIKIFNRNDSMERNQLNVSKHKNKV